MANGMEILFNTLVKAAGLNPDDVKNQIGGIAQSVVAFQGQLDRIERQQRAIMVHLNIPLEGEVISDGPTLEQSRKRSAEFGTGRDGSENAPASGREIPPNGGGKP